MKVKQFLKCQYWLSRSSYLIFMGVILTLYLLSMVLMMFIHEDGSSNGQDMAAIIFAFVMGIALCWDNLKMALANGVSRRTVFTSTLLSSLIGSAVLTVFTLCCTQLFGSLLNAYSIYSFTYEGYAASPFLSILAQALWQMALYFLSMMTGLLIAVIYYRLNKVATIAVSVGVPVFCFMVLPILFTLLPTLFTAFVSAFSKLFSFIARSPYHSCLVFLITAAVMAALSWLAMRRAPLRAQ